MSEAGLALEIVRKYLELRAEKSCLDLLEEELSHGTREFRGDLLWFHGNVHGRYFFASVRLLGSC